jgi:hypothetical protein
MTTEEIISKYPAEVIELAMASHSLITKTLPDVIEFPDEKANVIGYGYSNKYIDQVCTIILSKKGVKIGLNRGTELPDPNKLLEGTGKVHKYIQISSLKDLKDSAVRALLKAGNTAWKLRTKS